MLTVFAYSVSLIPDTSHVGIAIKFRITTRFRIRYKYGHKLNRYGVK